MQERLVSLWVLFWFFFFLPGSICIISTLPSAFGLVRRSVIVDPGIGF